MQNTPFSINKTLNVNGRLIDLSVPRTMGVLNVTPDSFFDGGRYETRDAILRQAEKMISEGADFIDIGGYSTRPGAREIPVEDERARVVAAVSTIAKRFPGTIISVDTFRSEVAVAAVEAGASMINDVSAGSLDDTMFTTVARLGVPYIAMHMRGTPQTMQGLTDYQDIVLDIIDYFHKKLHTLRQLGVKDVVIDPGFGFSKTVSQNFHLLHHLQTFSILQRPVLVGLSRKSMIWRTLETDPASALNGTTALNTIALIKGADILRVHDVREANELIKLFTTMNANVTA